MNLVGRLIGGRYEILEKIGSGGMATVYKAKCNALNRLVAIKVLRDEFTTDDEFIRRFNSEAQSSASLTHPNIVGIYDVGNEGDLYYIVMELIQGKTLKQIINEDGALPWKWSVNIAMQIAAALEIAHKNNIIHRDIKPHNIIITEDGIAKVTDFGIAKAVSNSTITAFGSTIGSVHYFSPEHARGGFTDAKSDLYSLGVVMYEMLTGKVPFDADTPVSIALKHMQEKATEPIKLNPTIPLSVNKIITKAMQKEGSVRYGTATEMLKDLSLAIKDPEGSFVKIEKKETDYPTQRISTIYDKTTHNRGDEEKETKKKNKIAEYLNKHKILRAFVLMGLALLIFIITLVITYFAINSSRPKEVQIPNIVGMTMKEAEDELKKIKVTLEVTAEEFDTVEAGKIISQEPKYIENYRIKEKTTIKVVISKGEEIVVMPKVVGKQKNEGIDELNIIGLKTIEVVEEINEKIEEGYITKQEPDENTELSTSTSVKIFVSKGNGKEKVDVPYVIGKTGADAQNLLTEMKIKVTIATEEDKSKNDGVVLKQSIEAGKTVDEGTEIIITVNEIQTVKSGTVNVNLKTLTGYKEEKDDEGKVKTPNKVTLMIKVGDDIVYKEKHFQDLEDVNVPIEGMGNVNIKIYIDDMLKKQGTLNLNQENPVLNVE